MIERKLINAAIKNYRTLKSCDTVIKTKKKDIGDFCEAYIKSYYPQEIFDLIQEDYIVRQDDITFRSWSGPLSKRPNIIKYFDTWGQFDIELHSRKLPLLIETSYGDISNDFLKGPHKEFAKDLSDKISGFFDEVEKFSNAMEAMEKVLSLPTMTLRELKTNYPELYNLIKQ